MKWDLRKIVNEKSTLYSSKEVVEIEHELIDTFNLGSEFDVSIRKMLNQLIEYSEAEGEISPKLDMMKIILNENDYNKVRN